LRRSASRAIISAMGFFKPFALERYFARYEFSVRHLLSASDCETISTRELLALEPGSEERFLSQRLGYTETRGDPRLRADLASLYKGLSADSILVHAGAEEAILDFCLATLSPGDHVVVNFPCYQSLAEIPRALGCAVDPWPLVEREASGPGGGRRWAFDIESLERLLGPKTRLVMLNAPHNPTGALPTLEEYEAIIALCSKAGALLFCDEVYRHLERDQARRLPPACELYDDAVSLNVLSKSAGLAGLRIGWLATRRSDILDAVAEAKDYGSLCASGPSEFLAGVAARHLPSLVARNRAIIETNLGLLEGFFARRSDFASWTRPEGGSVGFPRLTAGRDAEALSRRLVAETGVMILPGSCFSGDPSRFRLGFGRASLPEALSALELWLDGGGL
jgi:aspartate/methionine/tyrosine aminotransferase